MVTQTAVIQIITVGEEHLLRGFLSNAGSSLLSFRYFESRPLSVISNHFVTAVIIDNDKVIGYGHLDNDGSKVWLGIAVAEGFTGEGLGNKMMAFLMAQATLNKLKNIYLTVDTGNINAQKLYRKFGFVFTKKINEKAILMGKTMGN
jgi:ribosomal protein S18 acetylase RimI-like enzyme